MYNIKDNAEGQLQVPISSTTTTLVLQAGHGNRFPATPFLVVLNRRDNQGNITKSEKIEITARSGDQLTAVRGFEGSTPHDFNAGDFVSLFILSRHLEDIKNEITTTKGRAEDIHTTLNNKFNNYVPKNGAMTIGGAKTFSSPLTIPAPTANTHAVNKETMDTAISDALSTVGNISHLTETLYPLGETVSKNDCLYVEDMGRVEDITSFQEIGKTTANQKVAYRIMGNGVSSNSISLPLCAVGDSPIPLTVRIESGDNQPNGQLVHAQAQATINRNQITGTTSNYTMHTVSFPASFTIPSTAWVVLSQGTNTVNSTNYYGIGVSNTHSSTRYLATHNGSWQVLKHRDITNRENNVAGGTFNDGQKNTWRGVSLIAKNRVQIKRIDKINGSQANKVRIVKNGAIVGSYNLAGNTATINPAIAIEKGEQFAIEFAKGNNEYYVSQGFNMANSSAGTSDFYGARYSINGAISGGSDQGYNLNKIFVDVQDYPANTTIITGAGLHKQVLAKTNAQHPYKISGDGYARFAQSAGTTGTIVPVSYYGQHSGMNGLIPGMRYYLSGAPGLITTNASDGVLECGLALTSTTLLTTGVKGKIYSFQQQLRTNLQTHSHPLINQARFVVVSYGDYEFHRQKIATFSVTSVIGSSNYRTGITRVGDTITHRTNSTPYNDYNITFTFFL